MIPVGIKFGSRIMFLISLTLQNNSFMSSGAIMPIMVMYNRPFTECALTL